MNLLPLLPLLLASSPGPLTADDVAAMLALPAARDLAPREAAADSDGDGLPDDIEFFLGTDPFNRDTDGDGLTDYDEFLGALRAHATSPLDSDSDGDGIPDGEEDSDGDGLDNLAEMALGTDWLWPDTDHDRLRDGQEVVLGTNPLVSDTDGNGIRDGDEDADGDGLPLAEELALGSDPGNPDTDGDGVPDGLEVTLCTNPLLADSDGDHIPDGVADTFCLTRSPGDLADWKLYQRGPDGTATISVPFVYRLSRSARIEVALLASPSGLPLPGNAFSDHVQDVPAATTLAGAHGRLELTAPQGGGYTLVARVTAPDTGAVLLQDTVGELAVGDVFLAAGQSNMSGDNGSYPGAEVDRPDPRVHLFGNDYRWQEGHEPMDSPLGALDAVSNQDISATVSPMLRFAKEVSVAAGVPVAVIPASAGTTSLLPAPDFRSYIRTWERPPGDHADRGTLYGSAVYRVLGQRYGHPIRGVIWWQGEADANLGQTTAAYLRGLQALVANLREDLGNPALYFASCQLASVDTPDEAQQDRWLAIREAQRIQAAGDPSSTLVGLLDLPHLDPLHFYADGYREAGNRLAAAVLRGSYGIPIRVAPAVHRIHRRLDGTRVYIFYDKRIAGGDASQFRAREGDVTSPPSALRVFGRRLRLDFSPPLSPQATIGYGYGTSASPWIRARGGPGLALAFGQTPLGP